MNVAPTVSEAIVTWTGWRSHNCPDRDEKRLVATYGEAIAREILPRLRELEDDFYASDARYTAADLQEMSDIAVTHFRERHPEISDDAVRALAWCYTFDFK